MVASSGEIGGCDRAMRVFVEVRASAFGEISPRLGCSCTHHCDAGAVQPVVGDGEEAAAAHIIAMQVQCCPFPGDVQGLEGEELIGSAPGLMAYQCIG